MSDKRKKGCSNEHCIHYINKVKQASDSNYCPKCGSKLTYVCAKCFCEIEDIDPKHRICPKCKKEADEKRAQTIKNTKDIAIKLLYIPLSTVVNTVISNVTKDTQKIAVKKGTREAKKILNVLLKK